MRTGRCLSRCARGQRTEHRQVDPGTGRQSAHRLRGHEGLRQALLRVAGAILAVGCGVVLVMKATDGVRTTDSLSSQASIAHAAAQNAFYDCVSNQARKLVPKGASVAIGTGAETSGSGTSGTGRSGSTSASLTLLSAVVRWADVAPDASKATLVLELSPGNGPSSCSGLLVLATPGGLK